MKKILLAFLIPNFVWAGQHSSEIQKWTEFTPQKGYILSVDLHQEKMCSKIWTKQLSEFKRRNPHIKDPNMILVNQTILVQDCRVQIQEVSAPVLEQTKQVVNEKPKWFMGVFTGMSGVGSKSDDTSKSGYNLGVKVGQKFSVDNKKASLALGYLYNKVKTRDDNDSLGVYEVATDMLTLEGSLLYKMNQKFELGPKLMLVAGKDISLMEKEENRALGAYVGAEGLYQLSEKLDLELTLQQRLDDLSRVNAMGNIGLRLSF